VPAPADGEGDACRTRSVDRCGDVVGIGGESDAGGAAIYGAVPAMSYGLVVGVFRPYEATGKAPRAQSFCKGLAGCS
jgi:hypothetical protein